MMKPGMNRYRQHLFLLVFIISGPGSLTVSAQDNFGINWIFMTWHPQGNVNAHFQPKRLDPEARFVLNWGGVAAYERFIFRQRLSLKIAQGAYSDCAELFAGHTHIAFRLQLLNGGRHALRLGFGPTWVYRKSWYRFPGYVQENRYLETRGDWQRAFVWYGGEIEYDFRINKHLDIDLHIIPGVPDFYTFGVGARYWFSRPPTNREWRDQPKKNKWFYKRSDIAGAGFR